MSSNNSNIPYIITGSSISAIINSKSYSVDRSNAHAARILEALKNGEPAETLVGLFDLATAIKRYFQDADGIEVREDKVLYKGQPVHNTVTDRILSFLKEGLDYKPLIEFLKNLMNNPSRHSVTQLYSFLEKEGLPLTPDGCFIAYKGVDANGWSISSGPKEVVRIGYVNDGGHIRNHIGDVVVMERNYVCDNPNVHCSHGLHAGSHEYASGFGAKVVLVKINPKDCVSVPNDHDCQKLRVSAYQVVAECQGMLKDNLVNDCSTPYQNSVGADEDVELDLEDRGPFTVKSHTNNGDVVRIYEDADIETVESLIEDVIEPAGLNFKVYDADDIDVTSEFV